jgi:hypothetical protein
VDIEPLVRLGSPMRIHDKAWSIPMSFCLFDACLSKKNMY